MRCLPALAVISLFALTSLSPVAMANEAAAAHPAADASHPAPKDAHGNDCPPPTADKPDPGCKPEAPPVGDHAAPPAEGAKH